MFDHGAKTQKSSGRLIAFECFAVCPGSRPSELKTALIFCSETNCSWYVNFLFTLLSFQRENYSHITLSYTLNSKTFTALKLLIKKTLEKKLVLWIRVLAVIRNEMN